MSEPADTSPAPPSWLGRLLGALSERQFRRYTAGTLIWGTAYQLLTLAQGYTLYRLTDSTLYLAMQGAVTGAPQVVMPVIGRFLNDRLPRKQLLMTGSLVMAVVTAAIATVYALGEIQPWHILVAGAFQGALLGLDWTTRQAILPNVVSRERLVGGVSMDLTTFNLARIVAPLAGGAVLAAWGGPAAYGIIAGLLAANIMLALALRPAAGAPQHESGALLTDAKEVARLIGSDAVTLALLSVILALKLHHG